MVTVIKDSVVLRKETVGCMKTTKYRKVRSRALVQTNAAQPDTLKHHSRYHGDTDLPEWLVLDFLFVLLYQISPLHRGWKVLNFNTLFAL